MITSSPQVPPSSLESSPSTAPRAGLRCIGSGCETLVLHGRICDACLTAAAIALARRFESWLIADGLVAGSQDLRAELAGYATSMKVTWYQQHSELGEIGWTEAVALRNKADAACLLVGLGGIEALKYLPGVANPREAVAAWSDVPEIELEPEPGVVSSLHMETDDYLRDGRETAEFFGSLEREDAGVMPLPDECSFQLGYAAILAAIFLLLLVTR